MGKGDSNQQQQQQQQQQQNLQPGNRNILICQRCSVALSRIISLKCVFFLILSVFLLVSSIFWAFPFHSSHNLNNGFDAEQRFKLSATVQAYFRLVKPVSQLVLHIARLEYDINDEIGIPNAKVAILSMHEADASNLTDVVFGFLPDPINVPINPVFLSVLRSSLIELFLGQSNLTVTTPVFGQPSMFEVLKFPGGITVIPVQYALIWKMPQILFNFTLNNSISEILDNFGELKDQLEFGLHLRRYENVFVQITNEDGSTITTPVTVQASVMSDLGILLPQRLKQLAQIITASPVKNLGLDNSVFGKVKSVVLSSYLKGTLHATPPTPSPAPSPDPIDCAGPSFSPYPAISPSLPPATAPSDHSTHCATSPKRGPRQFLTPVNSPAPSMITSHPPHPCPQHGSATPPSIPPSYSDPIPHIHPVASPSQLPPYLSPLPAVSYGSSAGKGSVSPSLAPSALGPSPSSSAVDPFYRRVWLIGFSGLFIFHLLC